MAGRNRWIARAWALGAVLTAAAAVLLAAGSCGSRRSGGLRVGFLPNLTHAVPLVGLARDAWKTQLGGSVQAVPFPAGPAAVEALLADDVDVVYCGPGPAINAFIRTDGRVRVLAGAAEGGAAFVVRADLPIDDAADLAHRRLATPQIGNSQDIALRRYLWENDLAPSDLGGTVTVVPMANADILSLFKEKKLDGAWVPEPWATRLVREAGGRVFLDEATLWPGRRFPTTLLITTQHALENQPRLVAGAVEVNRQLVAWIDAHPAEAKRLVNGELAKLTGKKLDDAVIDDAWKRLRFDVDPMEMQLRDVARAAKRIGYLPRSDIRGILVDPDELSSDVTRGDHIAGGAR